MKISYAITVCNEFKELQELLQFLFLHKRAVDEVVVLFDKTNGTEEVRELLRRYNYDYGFDFRWYEKEFTNHFADWKNYLTSLCDNDYIFQIDADELPTVELMENLPYIIEQGVDVVLVPRVNIVRGITEEHTSRWGWRVNQAGWINWPDYQWRVYRKNETIFWKNKVHEVLEGFKTFAALPSDDKNLNLHLIHIKDIERQEKQNNFYDKL
jgi:hypothetical protein